MEQVQALDGQSATPIEQRTPEQSLTNRERVRLEYVHLCAVMHALGFAPPDVDEMDASAKMAKVERYMRYSERLGRVRIER